MNSCLQLWNGLLRSLIGTCKFIGDLAEKARVKNLVEIFMQRGEVDNVLNAAFAEGRDLIPEEIDNLTRICLDKGDNFHAYKAALLGASPELIERVLANKVGKGIISTSRDLAKKLGRELTAEEITTMIGFQIDSAKYSLWDINYVEKELRKLTADEYEKLLNRLISIGSAECALEVAERLGRQISAQEADRLLNACIWERLPGRGFLVVSTGRVSLPLQKRFIFTLVGSRDLYDFPCEMLEAIESIHAEGLISDEEIISICQKLIPMNALDRLAIGILLLAKDFSLAAGFIRRNAKEDYWRIFSGLKDSNAPKEYFDVLAVECAKHGNPDYAQWSAERAGRSLTQEEIESIFGHLVKGGWLSNVKRFAAETGRQPTAEEMKICLQEKIKREKKEK